jgi:hypothetical protein
MFNCKLEEKNNLSQKALVGSESANFGAGFSNSWIQIWIQKNAWIRIQNTVKKLDLFMGKWNMIKKR